jgi:dolichyl-phosphate beta-glucosyltransferase
MRLVSFVIPTLEETEIADSLDLLTSHLSGLPRDRFEILLVDDSGEAYKVAIRRYAERCRRIYGERITIRPIDGRHRGKGDAVRIGALAASGSVVFTMDADLPVPLKHIEGFLSVIDDQGFDVVIGERPLTRNLAEPARYLLSRALFAAQRAIVFGSNRFYDTQCGFKAFRGPLIRELAGRQIVSGGMYDIEYLYASIRLGACIRRVPVVQNEERRPSKIRVLRASMTDPVDLVRVRLRGLLGHYNRASGPAWTPPAGDGGPR